MDEDFTNASSVARLARSLFKSGDVKGSYSLLKKPWETDPEKIQLPEITQGLLLVGGSLSVESSYYAVRILMGGQNRAAAKNILKEALDTQLVFPGRDKAKLLYENTEW